MIAYTKETRDLLKPDQALEILKEGNQRFVNNIKKNRNLLEQVNETSSGQFPFAAILSCIDSRTSAELIFDQGLGDIFSIRIAGNILNDDILASMEFACKIAGSKLILGLGNKNCEEIEGAYKHIEMGHVTDLLAKIKPALRQVDELKDSGKNDHEILIEITRANVNLIVKKIRQESSILAEMEECGEIKIVGGLYDIEMGSVEFFV